MIEGRYVLNVGSLVMKIVPSYLIGNNLKSLLRALVCPIKQVNDRFVDWANVMHVANKVTSQKILLEKHLTNKLNMYFANTSQAFTIYHKNPITSDTFIYDAGSTGTHESIYAYKQSASSSSFNYVYGATFMATSFYVECPKFNASKISQAEYEAKIMAIVDMYKLSSKNYKLLYKS